VRFAACTLCGDDHPADLIVGGECPECRTVDTALDAATTAELCALCDEMRAEFYASLDYATDLEPA
jgi:hypothetical protein